MRFSLNFNVIAKIKIKDEYNRRPPIKMAGNDSCSVAKRRLSVPSKVNNTIP